MNLGEIFGKAAFDKTEYEQHQREYCRAEQVANYRRSTHEFLREGPSRDAVVAAFAAWTKCKSDCTVWGLECHMVELTPVRSGATSCVTVEVNFHSPYRTERALISNVLLPMGFGANSPATAMLNLNIKTVPNVRLCTTDLWATGTFSLSVLDTLGDSSASSTCNVAIPRAQTITFGAINASQMSDPHPNVAETADRTLVFAVDATKSARFYVPSTGAPDGIGRARLWMNYAANTPTRIRVAVVGDPESARTIRPSTEIVLEDFNAQVVPGFSTRRNAPVGEFEVRPGTNYIVIEADFGKDLPLINGFWFQM